MKPRVPEQENKASKNSDCNNLWGFVGVVVVGETPTLTRESIGKAHRILAHTKTHPPRNQHLKGHNPFVGGKGSDRKWEESRAG